MKITIAKTAGFCMGVRRAFNMALEAPTKYQNPIFTYGPLIHNPQVLKLLREKEISVINKIPNKGKGTVLIRAHGIPKKDKEELIKSGFNVIDATCPRVVKVQSIIKKYERKDYKTIIIGDKDHPEVIGLLGYTKSHGFVAGSYEELLTLPAFEKAIIVAQTTQNIEFFEKITKWAQEKFPHYIIFNTICDSTEKRQQEVNEFTSHVDTVIVVGGHNSGNTQRLYEIAKNSGKKAFHIETEAELSYKSIEHSKNIGITAGASTPNWIIKKVYSSLKEYALQKEKYFQKTIFTLLYALLYSNSYVALGAGCLCFACLYLEKASNYLLYIIVAILYVLAMHIFNNITGTEVDKCINPERTVFYSKHKKLLTFFTIVIAIGSLITSYLIGIWPFIVLMIISVAGALYNVKFFHKFTSNFKYKRIRDIPGSKTFLTTIAWGFIVSILPVLQLDKYNILNIITVFLWATSLVFVRTSMFDILDLHDDQIIGKETISTLLGEKKTIKILMFITIFSFFIIIFAAIFQIISNLGFILALNPLFLLSILLLYKYKKISSAVILEICIEANFYVAGLITFIWYLSHIN